MSAPLIAGGVIAGIAIAAVSATAAYQYSNQSEYAEVLSAKPAMQSVAVSRQECRDEVVTYKRDPKDSNKIIGTVAGAVVGGVIGNQIGSGRGNTAATVGGTVAGGYAGNRIQKAMQDRDTYQTTEQVCKTVQDSKMQQVGYNVIYRLDGQEQELHMDYDPGSRIPVTDGQLVLRD